ncbi:hypothetical protein AB0C93_36180 [Streptomyces sp. NPDC048518]|uniref:hypothetical protein n=1 Tax=Streptomyces sp. NPDC048518 TaxID=3155029 RepID=UPI0033DD464D
MTEPRTPADDRLAGALKRAADTGALAAAPAPAGQVTARGARRRRRVYAVTAALAVCLVSGGAALASVQLGRGGAPVGPAVPPSPTRSASVPESSRTDGSPSPLTRSPLTPATRTPPSLTPTGRPRAGRDAPPATTPPPSGRPSSSRSSTASATTPPTATATDTGG